MFESIIRPSQPKREQDDPKRSASGPERNQKNNSSTNLKKMIFSTFLNTDTSQEGIQTPEGHKKDTRNSKT